MGKRNLIGLLVLVAVLLLLPPLLGNPYYLGVMVWCGIYSLICLGLSLFMGYCGQISLGQAGFCALGAYVSGILTTRAGVGPWPAMAIAVLASLLMALAIGVPALRLRGHYLAMATLGFGVIIYVIVDGDPFGLTGGPSGFPGVPKLSVFGFVLNSELRWYIFVWSVVFIAMVFLLNLVNSRVGRALKSIHGGETAAAAMGINTMRHKIQAFLLSAALASLAGSFYAHYVGFVNPGPFSLVLSIHLVTMVAVGGMTNLWGAIAGTALLTILTRYFRAFKDIGVLLDGFILVIIMLLFPEGLFVGIARKLTDAIRGRSSKTPSRPSPASHDRKEVLT
jgi:branched-chain amino acid transport system permease protein